MKHKRFLTLDDVIIEDSSVESALLRNTYIKNFARSTSDLFSLFKY